MWAVATSAAVVGPWILLVALLLFCVLITSLVRLVLNKCIRASKERDVSVRVRLLLWLRIEIDVKTPRSEVEASRSGDPPAADVVPLREDFRESG